MKINFNQLKNREWYHQRFDGCPMFIGFIAEAEPKKEPRKPAGTEADVRVCFFEDAKDDWYLDMADVKRGVKVLLKLAKKDPNISAKLLSRWKEDEIAFEEFFQEIRKKDLTRLPLSELAQLWEKYRARAINRFTSSAIIDHFALGTDQFVADLLKKEIIKQDRSLTEADFAKIFAIASAPTKQSFFGLSEINLLKIALGRPGPKLKDHQAKYFWLNNNYIRDQVLTKEYFLKEIKSWKRSGRNLSEQLKKIEQTPIRNKKAKDGLYRKYRLSIFLRTMLQISDDFTWWQDERKRATYLNIHVGSKILAAIADRTGYKLDELKFAVSPEIKSIITRQSPTRKELRERIKGSAFVADRESIQFVTGSDAKKLRQAMFGNKQMQEIDDFRGLSASMGKAVGPVKVLQSSSEIGKVKPGDILVAVMTRPDYVVAMKKAAAIVTNEGGITSHAAIVSRELGIPCIIGTKIATEVLKDGDIVEVNANHGWVRKLK